MPAAMIHTLITHPGGAHKDELLAICVLIAQTGAPVFRRDPTPEELADPGVAVVDVGGVHDPATNNFDHHHFPREHAPTCSLSLLLQSQGLYEDALHFCDWLEVAEWFDSRGPGKTAKWLGVPRKAISQLNSPIDMTLLRRFAQASELSEGDPLYAFMGMVGQDLLDFLQQVRERIAFADEHCQRWSIRAGDETIEAVFLPRTETLPGQPSGTVGSYVRAHELDSEIAALVYPDSRGGGYGIARYEDHPQLDFSRVSEAEDVHFAHKSGFLCKTSADDEERLKALIREAWIPA
jgi:hypothetical protein